MIKKLLNYIWEKRNVILMAALVITCISIIAAPESAYALSADEIKQETIEKANTVIKFLNAMIWPMLMLIGALLDNDLIFGSGVEERLLTIWAQFRDFANIAFVIVLLIAAFVNIFSFSEEGSGNWEIKKLLPKFILGLVLINFSFIGSKVVLDATNVVTTAVFALPDSVKQAEQQTRYRDNSKEICQEIKNKQKNSILSSDLSASDAWLSRFCNVETKGDAVLLDAMLSNFNTRNAAFAMAINMGKLQLAEIKKPTVAFIKDFLVNTLFSLLMFVIYVSTFISLLLVLLGRVVILWLAVTLSPVFIAAMVLGEVINLPSNLGSGKVDELKQQVIANVTAPITIGLFMSVGYIMIDTFFARDDFYFDLPLGDTTTQITGMEDIRQILIAVITVVIVWKGVSFAVQNTIFAETISGIRGGLESIGKFIATSPIKYLPAIPIPTPAGKKAISISGLMDTLRNIPSTIRSKASQDAAEALGIGKTGTLIKQLDLAAKQDQETLAKAIHSAVTQNPKNEQIVSYALKLAEEHPDLRNKNNLIEVLKTARQESSNGGLQAGTIKLLKTEIEKITGKISKDKTTQVGSKNAKYTAAVATAVSNGNMPGGAEGVYLKGKGIKIGNIAKAAKNNPPEKIKAFKEELKKVGSLDDLVKLINKYQ